MRAFFLKRYKQIKPDFDIDKSNVREALRVNTLKTTHEEVLARLRKEKATLEKIPFLKDGYYYSSPNFSLGSTAEYLLGYYYIQEAASQAASEALNPKKGEVVLDMCASPGSKTTHIAQLMENKGKIIALDNNERRLYALRNNIERVGAKNTIIFNKDARYTSDLGITFDKVLLDAPCSGNFTLEEDWFDKRTLEDIKANSKVQRQLLEEAVSVLKDKGTMVYSTCSLEPEENEEIIAWGEDKLGIKVVSQKRYWPDEHGTQGFFIAVIKKK
ncbi:MAG: RsmB/NOP family class I SAM-dependent RNA methyltransferase [Nanoarchaeota archaeon]